MKGPCLERRAISCSRLLSPSIIQSFDNTVRLLYEFGGIKELLSGIPFPTNRLRRWHWNFYSTIGDFCPYVLLKGGRVGGGKKRCVRFVTCLYPVDKLSLLF